MRAPRLNRIVELLAPSADDDGAGGRALVYAPVATLWAEVVARSGRAAGAPHGSEAVTRYRVRVRAQAPGADGRPEPGMRFRDSQRTYLIDAVAEDARHVRYLTCWTTEEIAR